LPENNAIIVPATGTPAMIAKLVLHNTGFVAVMGALLFVSAGTWHWPGCGRSS
jgi:hypothetical protein